MGTSKKITTIFFFIIAFIGIVAGTVLVSQNQNLNEKAASLRNTPRGKPSPKSIIGDVNRDGLVNIVDIGILIDNYNLPVSNPNNDLNLDDVINIIDIGIVIDNYGS